MQPQDIDNFAIPWPKVVDYDPMGRIGLRVSLYFRDGYAIQRRQALLRIVEQYVAFAGDRIKLYQQAGERRTRTASHYLFSCRPFIGSSHSGNPPLIGAHGLR